MADDEMKEIFGDVIYSYGDDQAVADGVLVDISSLKLIFEGKPVNRMTGTLHHDMEEFLVTPEPKDVQLKRTLRTKLSMASGEGRIREIPPELWIVENELGGWTVMYPSDY